MIKEFREFLLRGNVLDLAIAVVIGAAFTAIVTAFTTNFVNPIIAAFGGGNVNGLAWQIVDGNEKSVIDFAAILTAIINFLIVAAVVYFLLVVPFKLIQERRKRGEEAGPAEPTEVELLVQIRDLLLQREGGGAHRNAVPGRSPSEGLPPGSYDDPSHEPRHRG